MKGQMNTTVKMPGALPKQISKHLNPVPLLGGVRGGFGIMIMLCAGLLAVNAAEKIVGGPKGGKLLEKTEPRAEFFVEKDHNVTITFYDANLKPVPVTTQSVTVIADAKAGKSTIEFEKKGDVLASKTKLPEGDGYNLVVQFKKTADATPLNLRFKLDMHICGGCSRAEYACTCGH
jgi:hypothetical protein